MVIQLAYELTDEIVAHVVQAVDQEVKYNLAYEGAWVQFQRGDITAVFAAGENYDNVSLLNLIAQVIEFKS
jgi:hypothetical protein